MREIQVLIGTYTDGNTGTDRHKNDGNTGTDRHKNEGNTGTDRHKNEGNTGTDRHKNEGNTGTDRHKNEIPILPLLLIRSPIVIQIYKKKIKNTD